MKELSGLINDQFLLKRREPDPRSLQFPVEDRAAEDA
jgi:hypothetical protein